MDSINSIISFVTIATFPSLSNIYILAKLLTQPILANLLIFPNQSNLGTIPTFVFTIYRLATLPKLSNLDIPHILVIILILPRLATRATPDNNLVLAAHSIYNSINTIISFATLATFHSFANLNILTTVLTQSILANLMISLRSLAWIQLLLFYVTINTFATLPTPADHDIPNILLKHFIHPTLPTNATPDNIPVLTAHSSLIQLILLFRSLHLLHSLHFLI